MAWLRDGGWWWTLAAVAVVIRLVLAFTLETNGDIENMEYVAALLRDRPLDVYSAQGSLRAWPYLTGYFPVVVAIRAVSEATAASFAEIARLPVILANVGLAWVVNSELRRRGTAESTRVAAAALLLLSPLFVLESGWHAQLDIVAVFFAVAGLIAWARLPVGWRAVSAGALIGGAIAIKTVPGIVVLALIPHARDRRELGLLVAATAAVPLALAAPWLVFDESIVQRAGRYRGLPGIGGLSLLVQPRLSEAWLNGTAVPFSAVQMQLQDVAHLLTYAGILAAGAVVWLRRPRPEVGAVLLLLAVYATAANWTQYYLLWIVPFLILAGWMRTAVISQVALLIPMVFVYERGISQTLTADGGSTALTMGLYVPVMLGLWLATVIGAALLAHRVLTDSSAA